MLPRSWSLPPTTYGFGRRDPSPEDLHRRKRRSKSSSCLEMSRELRILADHYEQQHKRRVERLRDYETKTCEMLNATEKKVLELVAQIEKLINDPLKVTDPKDLERRRREVAKKIPEEIPNLKDREILNSLIRMHEKEDEFSDKLELNRTMQMLAIRRKYDKS